MGLLFSCSSAGYFTFSQVHSTIRLNDSLLVALPPLVVLFSLVLSWAHSHCDLQITSLSGWIFSFLSLSNLHQPTCSITNPLCHELAYLYLSFLTMIDIQTFGLLVFLHLPYGISNPIRSSSRDRSPPIDQTNSANLVVFRIIFPYLVDTSPCWIYTCQTPIKRSCI